MTNVFLKGQFEHRHIHTGNTHVEMKAKMRVMLLYPKEHETMIANHHKPGERPRADFPSHLSEGTNLVPSSQMSSLQICDIIIIVV